MITKYGIDTFVKSLVMLLVVTAIALLLVGGIFARGLVIVCALTLGGLILNFFRDPDREIPEESNVVVAPADGRVMLIKELFEDEYLKQDCIQVSIFMSPLNVHVNRFPISGKVEVFRHIQGKYLAAFHEKSSEWNERTLIGVETDGYKVLLKQIAGTIARRIVAPLQVGQVAVCGEKFGMIKFGSRVDVIMPKRSILKVKMQERVVGGETILASYS